MIGGVVRIEALRAFTALVEREIPELAGHTCAGQSPSGEMEELPNLSIEEPEDWEWYPEQARQVATLPGNVAVYEMGYHESPCVVSIVASTVGEVRLLQAKVLDLFYSSVHPLTGFAMPGVLVFQVSSCPDLSRWSCSFDLDRDGNRNAHALDRRYEARLVVEACVPALTVRRPVYAIDKLVLAFVEIPSPTRPSVPPVELVIINQDGTLQAFTP